MQSAGRLTPTTMKLIPLLTTVLLPFSLAVAAQEYPAVTGVPTERLVKYLGKGGKERMATLDKVEKADAWSNGVLEIDSPCE